MNSISITFSDAAMFLALLVSVAMLVCSQRIGELLGVMDHPDGGRKRHRRATPLVGGLAMMVPFVLWAALVQISSPDSLVSPTLLAMLLCAAGATLIGYADDQSAMSTSSRFLALVLLSVMALVLDPGLVPARLNWGSFAPLPLAPWVAFVFVAVAMTGFVNAVNMADGQNGLVAGMYVIWAGCLALVTHGATMDVAQVVLMTSLLVMAFNLAGKVFLGDAGTYGGTFLFGLLAIIAHNRWGVTAETITVWFFIPIVDCLRLMISRLLHGHAPTMADRDHFHHRLESKLGAKTGLCVYLFAVGGTSLIASLLPQMALVCMVVLSAFYFSFAWLAEVQSELSVAPAAGDAPRAAPANVVKLPSNDVGRG